MHNHSPSVAKPRVLIADDSKVMRYTARKILGEDYDLVEAENGEQAWQQLAGDDTIQVVVSDLGMPELDGFELLARIRGAEDRRVQQVPVIIITGREDDDDTRQQALRAGATDFIAKPFDAVQLRARTQAHVRFDATTRQLAETASALEAQATTDALTGLTNRRQFMARGREALSFALRHRTALAAVRIELDGWEALSEREGNAGAEEALRQVGQVIGAAVRHEDVAARIGRASFALLLPATGELGAGRLAERLRRQVESTRLAAGSAASHLTLSVGVAAPELGPDTTFGDILREADERVRTAHVQGGNRLVLGLPPGREPPAEGAGVPDLDAAVRMVREGRLEAVQPHLPGLLETLLPLLRLADRELGLDLDSQLEGVTGEAADDQAQRR